MSLNSAKFIIHEISCLSWEPWFREVAERKVLRTEEPCKVLFKANLPFEISQDMILDLTNAYDHWIHTMSCKKSPNLPILRLIHKLKGIMVNKGRIHGELGNFERYLWNSIKSDNELSLEIRHFIILRKITQFQIYGIKNWVIWMRIRGVIEVWNWEKNSIAKLIKNWN